MSLSALAWGPGHPSIVTYDEAELLAYDSESEGPKWRLALDRPVAGVVLADATFLDIGDAATPFRTPAAASAVLAIDADGRLHAIDASSGRKLGDVGPFGAPRSLAASIAGQGIAVAVRGKVHVWRKSARAELSYDATALAFSNDGATLAIATEQGVIKFLDLTGLDADGDASEVRSFDARGPVADLVQHPNGAWLVCGSRATLRIDPPGVEHALEKIPVGAKRVTFDASGSRVAVQLSQRQVLVYDWPQLSVLTRIEYTERPIRGIAFGKGDWLGVAMDYGDGNKIDVITSSVHRTDTHPGREHRSWSLYVEGGKKPAAPGLSSADEDAVRRMRETPPSDGGGFGRGGRIGIITIISLGLLGLRLCARAGSSSSSSYSSSSSSGYTPSATCDRACATERLSRVVKDCATAGCSSDAEEAAVALSAGDCTKAKAALARVPKDSPDVPLLGVDKLLADLGLQEACAGGSITPKKKVVHPKLVRLVGPLNSESSEDIPEADSSDGEKPRAAWTASDGTLFVVGITGGARSFLVIHRRSPTGEWKIDLNTPTSDPDAAVSIAGRSASDVYALVGSKLMHFDGKIWDQASTSPFGATWIGTTTNDVLLLAQGSDGSDVYRRTKTDWVKDKAPNDLVFKEVRAGGPSAWTIGVANSMPAVAARGADGSWSTKTASIDGGTGEPFVNLWVSPTGDPFLFTEGTIVRGSAGSTKWVEDEMIVAGAVKSIWGRSSSDVYAASFSRLLHFDGKTWTSTTYVGKAAALTGTAKEVFVLRSDD